MIKGGSISSILALSVALAGCTGMVSSSDGQPSLNGNPSGGGSGSTTGTGGNGSTPGTAGSSGAPATVPGIDLMHRLNTAEYNATVMDVLGTKLQPATLNWRGGEKDGFDNIASALGIDGDQYGLYLDAAEALSLDVFANDATKGKVLSCTTTDDTACVTTIINQTGLRLFRRPVLADEVATYSKVYKAARAQGEDHASSVRHILWGMLSSAQFLYRIELDNGVTTKHPVTGYELASRLSYFLWSSAPDDAMLAAANTLDSDTVINAAVDRMLADPKSSRFVTNFAGQWLGARNVSSHPVDHALYPKWTPDTANAAAAEVFSYFDEFLRQNKPWTDFLKADINFVNAPLAAFYGIPNVTGTTATRVVYAQDNRAGFLSLVGFLANSSVAARSSPTLRGKWLLVNLLCAPPLPAPANVPKLEATNPHPESTSVRAVLEAHRAAAGCKVCHTTMDPFGLALEQYDGVGQFRSAYPDNTPIDATTSLPKSDSFPNGVEFTGLDGAANTVGTDPRFKSCVAEKLYTYGLGRSLSTGDKENVTALSKTWQDAGDLSIAKLVHDLAVADAFRTRIPAP